MITGYLTEPSVISLALTGRTLFTFCFPQHPCLNKEEKEYLLQLLEKDIATLLFCHRCVKLHRWRTRWLSPMISLDARVNKDLPCMWDHLIDHLRFPPSYFLPYYHARLVMNRHFYGPTHGLSLHRLNWRVEEHYSSTGITSSSSCSARIVDDKLLLLSVVTISHSHGNSEILRRYIDSRGDRCCAHLTLGLRSSSPESVQLPLITKDKTAPTYFAPCGQSFGSCTNCLTDYCIHISWHSMKEGYVIELLIYVEVRDCRSPFDWSWSSITGKDHLALELRTANPLKYRPGIIIDRWGKDDDFYDKTRRKWVQSPELHRWRGIISPNRVGHRARD